MKCRNFGGSTFSSRSYVDCAFSRIFPTICTANVGTERTNENFPVWYVFKELTITQSSQKTDIERRRRLQREAQGQRRSNEHSSEREERRELNSNARRIARSLLSTDKDRC